MQLFHIFQLSKNSWENVHIHFRSLFSTAETINAESRVEENIRTKPTAPYITSFISVYFLFVIIFDCECLLSLLALTVIVRAPSSLSLLVYVPLAVSTRCWRKCMNVKLHPPSLPEKRFSASISGELQRNIKCYYFGPMNCV